jgi:hypothetical protein
MKVEEFRAMENKYNAWLEKHPKGDHNYKSFSHMRRSVEFANYVANQRVIEELELILSIEKETGIVPINALKHKLKELKQE